MVIGGAASQSEIFFSCELIILRNFVKNQVFFYNFSNIFFKQIKEKRRMPEADSGIQGSTPFDEQEIKRTAYKKEMKKKALRKQADIGQIDKEYVKIKSRKPYEIKTGNDSIKTIENSRQVTIKTSGTVSRQIEQAKKMSVIATERARQAVKFSAKTIEILVKKAVIVLTSCLKAISAALSNLIATLGAGGGIAALILIIVLSFGQLMKQSQCLRNLCITLMLFSQVSLMQIQY